MLRKILKGILPRPLLASLKNYKILSFDFGQFGTMGAFNSVDRMKNPIPWYTYPAIEYLKQLDFSNKIIFEYGSGNSTRFWAERCKTLVSVEHDKVWYDKIKPTLPDNVEYYLFEETQDYIKSIAKYPDNFFDVVTIDGIHRSHCAAEAIVKLRDDGFAILDNSDWNEKASQLFREADMIEVDMSGFGAINSYTWMTSFYFRRNVNLTLAHERQPVHGIGSVKIREPF
ncbi:SAM-dependent methyltransferase [Oscillatoria sp. FACHB-1406]|uniref:SAM-dependent methyltransferase n=1 Tax=Oscillatoria sp. FACHB-1406 TaxID=2692846 RepID=UPI001682F642|nr:SAM-dependent methyltransferase [Oscillatoria sp. FACHB-1406]MBD2577872.1 SAM-dependent methyltransferase [Oscillatoria sp. FACHB-1406]